MLWEFFSKVVLISASGALSPGPLTASIIGSGLKKGWKAGFLASVGHALIEFPFIVLISLGIALMLTNRILISIIGGIGSLLLLYIGYSMIKDAIKGAESPITRIHEKPLLLGVALSALNPYFLLWWIFIGGILIIDALNLFGYLGIPILFVMHIWLDFAWLTLISFLSSKGRNILKTTGYKIMLGIIGALIIIFGIDLFCSIFLGSHIVPW